MPGLMSSTLRAWLAGFSVLLAAYGGWYVALRTEAVSHALAVFLWLSPTVAALIAAYFSPRRKMAAGLSMAPAAAVLSVVFNGLWQMLGERTDFAGVEGAVILFAMTLAYSGVGSLAGGVGGIILSRNA